MQCFTLLDWTDANHTVTIFGLTTLIYLQQLVALKEAQLQCTDVLHGMYAMSHARHRHSQTANVMLSKATEKYATKDDGVPETMRPGKFDWRLYSNASC